MRLLTDIQAIHAAYRATCPRPSAEKLEEAGKLLASVATQSDTEQAGKLLATVDQVLVPEFDFEQGWYDGCHASGEHPNDFVGSLNHRIRLVCNALRAERDDYLGYGGFILAVYPDSVVICHQDYYYADDDRITYWRVPYAVGDAGAVTFGEKTQVEVRTVVIEPVSTGDAAEQTAETGDAPAGEASAEAAETPAAEQAEATSAAPAPAVEFVPVEQGESQDQELIQTITVQLQDEGTDAATGVMHVSGVATVGNLINANGEVYPTSVWEANMPRFQEMIEAGRLLGETDHPKDGYGALQRTSIKYKKFWQDGDRFLFEADILPTVPQGINLQTLVRNGVAVDISSRGRGRMVQGTWNGVENVKIVQPGFRGDAFDAVQKGASPGSTITDWSMAQSADSQSREIDQEEDEMSGISEKVLEALQGQAAANAAILETLKAMQGNGNGTPPPAETRQEQGAQGVQTANDLAVGATTGGEQITHTSEEMALFRQNVVQTRINQHLASLAGWSPRMIELLRKQIDTAAPSTLAEANAVIQSRTELVEQMMQQAPQFPSNGFTVQKDRGMRGPQTPGEMIEAIIDGMPDTPAQPPMSLSFQQDEEGDAPQDWVLTPKRQLRKYLKNIVRINQDGFNGQAALINLMRLEQGFRPDTHPEAFFNQACADMTSAVGASGAPQSAIYVFPLIRRVFPQLIAMELASIQPMDRPDGKIFFLDIYRNSPTTSETDESGNISSSRMRIDRSESFLPTYADDPGECETSVQLQLHMSSKSVTAVAKKLHAVWSIEEVQDLRAYHGLDAQGELLGALSTEIALEWNQLVLQDLLNGATAGNRTYGTTAPSGYTAKEWEEYLPRYIDAASNDIFRNRHGEATHVIAGPSAWLRLSAAFRAGTRGAGENPEMFAGLTLTPFMAGSMVNLRTFKTSFWSGVNADKILVIRRGANWSDTPYVWAPYATYVSPTLTLPDAFTQKQGIMDRAARKVVVGQAMATVTISAGTGVPVS